MIIAKPKGKTKQHLVSYGGEKRPLTATALLFAIYLMALFCILIVDVTLMMLLASLQRYTGV